MKDDHKALVYQKNADSLKNRVMLPKAFIDRWGRRFYMEVYTDKIILIPIKNMKE